MAISRARQFSKLAKDVSPTGDIKASGIDAGVSLGSSTEIYDSIGLLPYVGNEAGDQAFVNSNNRLYIWQGSGWYNVALINRAPSISSVQDSDGNTTPFTLSSEGAVTTITITAADSDGDPITYSAIADSDFSGIGTLAQDGNEFTITPFSQDSATASSGTITFRATDGVNIASSGVQTFTLSFISELWLDVVLSIGMADSDGLDNSTFIDRSTNAHTVTPTGTPTQTAFHPYLDNWSVEFDGTANNIPYIANNAAFNVAGGDYTIEFWFYGDGGISGTRQVMFSTYDNPSGGIGVNWNADNTFGITLSGDGFDITSTETITFNEWHHGAIVSNSGTVTLYLDGVSVGTTTNSTVNGVRPLVIGCLYNDFNNTWILPFSGYISNLRIIKGTALYTANFTPPTEKLTAVANTTVLTCQSNRFVETASDLTFTFRGNPAISAFNPFGQGSEYAAGENKGSTELDGSGDYLSVADDGSFDFGTGDFTIETWIYATSSLTSSNLTIIDARPASGSTTGNYYFLISSTGKLRLIHALGASDTIYESTSTLSPNQWYHVVASRSGDNLRLFIDGVVENTTSVSGKSFNATLFNIGYKSLTTSGLTYWPGYLSDLRIVKGTALYTTNFTPPTAPVGNTNASLYLPMDNAGVFDKTGNTTLVVPTEAANGAPLTDTSIKKYSSSSMNFGTTSQDKLWQVNGVPPLGSGPFTIEGWIYPTSVDGTWQSVITRDYGATGGWRLYKRASTPEFVWYRSSTATLTTDEATKALVDDTWQHFAVCRDENDDLRIFIDGVQTGPTVANTYDYSAADPDNPLNIGSGGKGDTSGYPFSGNLEGVQVFLGVAKYTANFTPPTKEQGRIYQAED